MAVMIHRLVDYFESITGRSDTTGFADNNSIDTWAKQSVFYAEREGFLAGSNGKILPPDRGGGRVFFFDETHGQMTSFIA